MRASTIPVKDANLSSSTDRSASSSPDIKFTLSCWPATPTGVSFQDKQPDIAEGDTSVEDEDDDDDDEHTLVAFGDISLSSSNFIPISSWQEYDLSPNNSLRLKRGKPLMPRRKSSPKHRQLLPKSSLTQIASKAPPLVSQSETMDFKALLQSLKASRNRISKRVEAKPATPAPLARGTGNTKGAAQKQSAEDQKTCYEGSIPVSQNAPSADSVSAPAVAKEKQPTPVENANLRGSTRLPKRPPIPRWD